MMRNGIVTALAGAALAALAGCTTTTAPPTSPTPTVVIAPPSVTPSAESVAYVQYYANVQQRLLTQGLLRTDGGGPDTPIVPRNLAANFEQIAFYNEYALSNGRYVALETPSTLRRWERPVRIQPHFGASVPASVQSNDRTVLTQYAERLARVSGHNIRTVGSGGNFHVLYLNRDEQMGSEPLLRQIMPSISAGLIREITNMPRYNFCSVYMVSQANNPAIFVSAIAIIRTEHPDLQRRSCVHEEVAQGLGLPNDSPAARPSIFNDDEEFALLTTHDEMLLSMLYNPNLRPGMTADEARPTVRLLAQGLVAGPS